MIKVKINKTTQGHIAKFIISGHANSSANNKYDLVCAGVSAVSVGILNSLDTSKVDVDMKDGFISIDVKKYSKDNNFTLNILMKSLETIKKDNGKYISIKEEVK